MDAILALKASILGIVEGLTEFLPVSSTGHLIVAGDLMGWNDARGKLFEIVIQFAAILAVCWEYRAKLGAVIARLPSDPKARSFALNLIIAFVPAALLGALTANAIKQRLFAPVPVALAFIVGAAVIFWVEARPRRVRIDHVDDLRWRDALWIGIAQTFALIPGTSRSGATIIGGMLTGLSRRAATEFSFFLAIPTIFAATVYELYKERHLIDGSASQLIAVGSVTSFVSAFFAVRALLRYVSTHDLKAFAWYRIAFGVVILVTAYAGWVSWSTH
jgi:undecaprenyl-diphosphatase